MHCYERMGMKRKNIFLGKQPILISLAVLVLVLIAGFVWVFSGPKSIDEGDFIFDEWEENAGASDSREAHLIISSTMDWQFFIEDVNSGNDYADFIVLLDADLNFEESGNILPVGTEQTPFRGIFDGNNHRISNVSIISQDKYVGLFAVTEFAEIKNLILQDCIIYSEDAIGTGGIVGCADSSTIRNCSVGGEMFSSHGSVGGIVGNNRSEIYNCNVEGAIVGSTVSGSYGDTSYGTGGISGDNRGYIYMCTNRASVSDDCETHESNTSRSGGITGYNYSFIESCTNYGAVTGGGIAKTNNKYATIRLCVNLGDVYSGISLGSYQDSAIDYCVNLGKTSGRYAGDIVSFWGQDSETNTYGAIERCLYINSSEVGVARIKSFEKSSLSNNYKIRKLSTIEGTELNQYLEKNEIEQLYNSLVMRERKQRLMSVIIICLSIMSLTIFGIFCRKSLETNNSSKIYKKAQQYIDEKEYWLACKALLEINEYKDYESIIKKCTELMLEQARDTGLLRMGTCNENETIEWTLVRDENNQIYYLARSAVAMGRVNSELECKTWDNTELASKLQTDYKEKWFGKIAEKYVSVEVSIPDIHEVQKLVISRSLMKCGNEYKIPEMLMRSGYVYWWLKGDINSGRLPFVSADGLINERGKMITDELAVRPIIKVEMHEKSN